MNREERPGCFNYFLKFTSSSDSQCAGVVYMRNLFIKDVSVKILIKATLNTTQLTSKQSGVQISFEPLEQGNFYLPFVICEIAFS